MSLSAEGLSTKLRGKLVLAGVLSSVAILTRTLVTRDRHDAEKLQAQLGPTEQIIQIERGFDKWEVHYYGTQSYFFMNNRFIRKRGSTPFFLSQTSLDYMRWRAAPYSLPSWDKPFSTFLSDTSVSMNPKWWSICPSLQRINYQFATPYLHRLADELLPDLLRSPPRLR